MNKNLIDITLFRDPLRLHYVNLRYFGCHFEKRPLARVPHITQRLAPSHLIQCPRIYKKTPSILLAPKSRTGPQFWTLLPSICLTSVSMTMWRFTVPAYIVLFPFLSMLTYHDIFCTNNVWSILFDIFTKCVQLGKRVQLGETTILRFGCVLKLTQFPLPNSYTSKLFLTRYSKSS